MPRKLSPITLATALKQTIVIPMLLIITLEAVAQQVHSFGIFAGINLPGTIDAGINRDPRYRTRYAIKAVPVGFHYGVDLRGIGFSVDPYYFRTGQNYYVINTVGGQIGERNTNIDYLRLPITFKAHLIDMSFFRLSFVASAGAGILMKGKETIWHYDGLMFFPPETYSKLPAEYVVDTEAVSVPDLKETGLLEKSDFKPLMIFAGAGFRSDWDKTETFRVSFDLRMNYGFSDPRTKEYTEKVKAFDAIYDIYGRRRELFITLTVGVSKTIQMSTPQSEQRYRRKKTREWRAPSYIKPKKGKDN